MTFRLRLSRTLWPRLVILWFIWMAIFSYNLYEAYQAQPLAQPDIQGVLILPGSVSPSVLTFTDG